MEPFVCKFGKSSSDGGQLEQRKRASTEHERAECLQVAAGNTASLERASGLVPLAVSR